MGIVMTRQALHVGQPSANIRIRFEVKEVREARLQLTDFRVGGEVGNGDLIGGEKSGLREPTGVEHTQRTRDVGARRLLREPAARTVLRKFWALVCPRSFQHPDFVCGFCQPPSRQ